MLTTEAKLAVITCLTTFVVKISNVTVPLSNVLVFVNNTISRPFGRLFYFISLCYNEFRQRETTADNLLWKHRKKDRAATLSFLLC